MAATLFVFSAAGAPPGIVGWGYNRYGQTTVPAGLTSVAIAAGGEHSLALKNDGTVVAWGFNDFSQTTIPAGLTGVVGTAAGQLHSLALKSDGSVIGWGYNYYGQTTVPAGLTGVVATAAGYYHSLALKSDGTVIGWGWNYYGQTTVPGGLTNVVAIAAGQLHSLALKSDGSVIGWGYNDYGQTTVPAGLTGVVAIASGARHSLALKSDGSVIGWGNNGNGQTTVPAGLTGVVAIAAGSEHSLALYRVTMPSIITAPQSQTVIALSNLTFTVTATGTAPLSYQWQFNGVNIIGATNADLTLTSVSFANAGNYNVVLNNAYGSVTSVTATLTVLPTIRYYYDRNDRLVGVEYARGISIAYQYDGNGNLIRQLTMSRASETNGLPVLWKFLNGLAGTNAATADGLYDDPDGDGWTNYQEWKAGTNPKDAQSTPNLLGNPGTNIASLTLPFTPSNFVVGVGQLDGLRAEEIVLGADGNPGTNINFLLVLTQTSTGWQTQRVDVGTFGITSIAVGQVTNRPSAAIYIGLRGATNGSGRVMEFTSSGGVWQSNLVALSTNQAAFVLGVLGQDALVSIATTNLPDGSLSAARFTTTWKLSLLDGHSSRRGLGTLLPSQSLGGSARALRLLDSGSIAAGSLGFGVLTSNLLSYWRLDESSGNITDSAASNNTLMNYNTVTFSPGLIENCANFGNDGGFRNLRRNDSLGLTVDQPKSFSFWLKMNFDADSNHEWPLQIAFGGVTTSGYVGFYYQGSTHNLAIIKTDNNGHSALIEDTVTLGTTSWHHLVGTTDGTTWRLYVDGTLAGNAADYVNNGGNGVYPTPFFTLGAGDRPDRFSIDEAGVWSRALSADEVTLLYGNGSGVANVPELSGLLIPELAATRTNNWRGDSLAAGFLHGANGSSIFYTFTDDKNANGVVDFGDDFVTAEYLVSGTNASLLTLSRQFIASPTVAQSYGLASVNYLNRSNEVFFTGEPDGHVFAWTGDGSTNALRRDLFSAYHSGYGWHAMTSVKTLEPGEGLAGLRVNPTNPATCNVILWPPQPVLNIPANLIHQTAPLARVLPAPAAGGTIADVHVRLWDSEGDASLPYLQFSPDTTNWFDVTNITQMDSQAWNVNTRLSAPPGGAEHSLFWNTTGLFTTGITNIFLRTRARDVTLLGDWSEPSPYTITISADSDGDGLPDAWEIARFGNLSQGPNGDPDGDGFTNLQEYLADTDPADGNSYLRITGIHRVANSMQIDWKGGIQATQYLQRRFSIGTSNLIWQDIYTSPPPTSVSGYYQDLMGTNKAGWYRIRVKR